MKLLILFLFCCSSILNSCAQRKDALTERKIIESFRMKAYSASTYGIRQGGIHSNRPKWTAKKQWSFPVNFTDGARHYLNLKLTDGILIDRAITPVWVARGRRIWDDRIVYIPDDKILRDVGRFSLYQDFENKAAIVVFHRPGIIVGIVGNYSFEETEHCQLASDALDTITFALKSKPESPESIATGPSSGSWADWYTQVDEDHQSPPTTVYPQILVQIDRADFQVNDLAAVRKMIAYWNAVDMLYSEFQGPQIKINIAGFIIPLDAYAAPWAAKNVHKRQLGEFVDGNGALVDLGIHMSSLRREFPDDSYDFVFSFLSDPIDIDERAIRGIAYSGASCWYREHRVSIVKNNATYITAALQLAHLLSNDRETIPSYADENDEKLDWFDYSRNNFTDYFRKPESQCFDNCPATLQTCKPPPISRCVRTPGDVCRRSWYGYSNRQSEDLKCDEDIVCHDGEHARDVPIPIPDGTICEWDSNQRPNMICRNGQPVPYHDKDGVCGNNIL